MGDAEHLPSPDKNDVLLDKSLCVSRDKWTGLYFKVYVRHVMSYALNVFQIIDYSRSCQKEIILKLLKAKQDFIPMENFSLDNFKFFQDKSFENE